MGKAYHTRVLKLYTLLLEDLAFHDNAYLTSYFHTATRIWGAEPELLDFFTCWYELLSPNFHPISMDWCLEWLEVSSESQ